MAGKNGIKFHLSLGFSGLTGDSVACRDDISNDSCSQITNGFDPKLVGCGDQTECRAGVKARLESVYLSPYLHCMGMVHRARGASRGSLSSEQDQ